MASSSGLPERVPFYAPVEGRLNQGDIIKGVAWGVVVAPLEVCRKQGGPRQATVNTVDTLPSAFKKGWELVLAHAQQGLVMVLWPDCQLDKFLNQNRPEDRWFAGVAPVVALTKLGLSTQQEVRDGLRRMYFYVPANDPLGISESYVDLRHIWPVKQSALVDRVASISVAALSALHAQLFAFFTYLRRKEPAGCPACGAPIPDSALFETDFTTDAE